MRVDTTLIVVEHRVAWGRVVFIFILSIRLLVFIFILNIYFNSSPSCEFRIEINGTAFRGSSKEQFSNNHNNENDLTGDADNFNKKKLEN